MELGTFGAVLTFAAELEESSAAFYDGLAGKSSGETRELFASLAGSSRKNKQVIDRTRRMNVAEMILEAITGLDSQNYSANFDVPGDQKAGAARAMELEQKASAFYSDAARKMGFLPDVKRTLEKVGKERAERVQRLKAHL